jgi:hypothetical protein
MTDVVLTPGALRLDIKCGDEMHYAIVGTRGSLYLSHHNIADEITALAMGDEAQGCSLFLHRWLQNRQGSSSDWRTLLDTTQHPLYTNVYDHPIYIRYLGTKDRLDNRIRSLSRMQDDPLEDASLDPKERATIIVATQQLLRCSYPTSYKVMPISLGAGFGLLTVSRLLVLKWDWLDRVYRQGLATVTRQVQMDGKNRRVKEFVVGVFPRAGAPDSTLGEWSERRRQAYVRVLEHDPITKAAYLVNRWVPLPKTKPRCTGG